MHKVYILLRNNKQQGPYSLEELLRQSLKPFDLVWVEGRSAGWKYPTEIEALKPYVADQQQPIAKKEILPVEELAEENVVEESKSLARKRIYVSLPGGHIPAAISTAETSFSEKLEKKAEELYQRAQAYAEGRKQQFNTEPEIDTKYTRSLDDIKEEYSNWLYQQKRNKKGRTHKKLLLFTGGLVLLAASIFTSKFLLGSGSFDSEVQKLANETVNGNAKTEVPYVPANQLVNPVKKPVISKKSNEKNKNTALKKKTVPPSSRTEKKTSKISSEKKQRPQVSSAQLPELVKITGQYKARVKGIPDFAITVKNNSGETLDFVAVDVFYYKNDGSLTAKKTLYFNHVLPYTTTTRTAPGNSKADDVIFRMGLMSSQESGLYYAKQ